MAGGTWVRVTTNGEPRWRLAGVESVERADIPAALYGEGARALVKESRSASRWTVGLDGLWTNAVGAVKTFAAEDFAADTLVQVFGIASLERGATTLQVDDDEDQP